MIMRVSCVILFGCAALLSAVDGQGYRPRPVSQALQSLGSGISSALQNPGQTLASYFPAGLGGLFPFSVSNLPSMPQFQLPQRVPQIMMNGVRNATRIIRASLMNPVSGTVAVLAAPLVPLIGMGGPAGMAGLHHAINMGLNEYRSAHERRRRSIDSVIPQRYHHHLRP